MPPPKRKTTLEQWISGALSDPEKEGPCTMISLVHLVGTVEEEVHSTKLGKGNTWTAKDLSETFQRKAETYSQDMPGAQTFRLLAFYNDSREAQAKQRFVVQGQLDDSFGVTEPPTKDGRIAQDMRITEGVVKTSLQMVNNLLDKQNDLMDRVMARLEKSEERNVTAIELAERVILERARQVQEMERQQLWNELARKGITLAPAIVNALTGKEIFPQSTEDTALIEALAEQVTPQQIEMIAGALPPEVSGILIARMRKAEETRKERQKEALARPAEVIVDAEEAEKDPDNVKQLAGKVASDGH